jgi:predicted GNAT family acetyltransferase
MEPNIKHDPERCSFSAEVEGGRAHLDYRLASGVMTILHTKVPPEAEGHGIAGALVRSALGHAERAGFRVEPLCAYARAYMDRHAETAALRA